jgi:hypothetical protein
LAPGDVGEQIYKPLTLKKFGVLSNLKHIWEYGGDYRLANILQMNFLSVYQKLGNLNGRKDLNRLIRCKIIATNDTTIIMWKRT